MTRGGQLRVLLHSLNMIEEAEAYGRLLATPSS
jgi:hypothetical protein